MKEFLENRTVEDLYSALDVFKRHIETLSKIPMSDLTFQSIQESLNNTIKFFPFIISPETNTRKRSFWRVRINEGNIDPTNIHEFGTAPAKTSLKFQRANVPFQPVFYGSITADAAVYETFYYNPDKTNCEFYLAEWVMRIPTRLITTPFLFKENVNSRLNTSLATLNEKLDEILKELTPEKRNFAIRYFEYIIQEFTNPESYVLSSFTAHNSIYASHNMKTDVFYYPTVKKMHHGVNVAIHPQFAKDCLVLNKIYLCKVEQITSVNIKYTHLKIGDVMNGFITFRDIYSEDLRIINEENTMEAND